MSTFRHSIDGIPVSEPLDWPGFTQEVVRDFSLRLISVQYPTAAKFGADGYKMLRDMFLQDRCRAVTYQVVETCGGVSYTIPPSVIILSDCDWNLRDCTVDVSLVDDAIGARIANNKAIPIRPFSETTKNGAVLAPCTEFLLEVYTTTQPVNVYLATPRRVVDWFDAMRHALAYVTDANVTLASAWYTNLPDDERYALTIGWQLRTGNANTLPLGIEWTLESLFNEVAIRYDLWMFVTRSANGDPILNIEPYADTFVDAVAVDASDSEELTQSIASDRLYAKVVVGSESAIRNQDAVWSLPYIVLQGFSEEEFALEGVCNSDRVLNLAGKWVTCTNRIQQIVAGGSGEEAENIVIIQYDRNTLRAIKGEYLDAGSPPYLYNPALLNGVVLGRHALPLPLGVTFGPVTGVFRATGTADGAPFVDTTPAGSGTGFTLLNFDDDSTPPNEDPDGAWDPVLMRYTAATQGFYSFVVERRWRIAVNTWPAQWPSNRIDKGAQSAMRARRYDSLGNLIATIALAPSPAIAAFAVGDYLHRGSFRLVMDPGDYVEFEGVFTTTGVAPTQSGAIEVLDKAGRVAFTALVANGGGQLPDSLEEIAAIVEYKAKVHVPAQSWVQLVDDPRKVVTIDGRRTYTGRITRTLGTGDTDIETIAKNTEPL
jgi:hypothetical protein